MKNLLKYEFQKFIYNKKNLVIIVSIIISLISFVGYNHYLDQQYSINMKNEMLEIANYSSKTAKGIEISMKNLEEGEQKEQLREQKQFWADLNSKSLILVNYYIFDSYQEIEFIKSEILWNKLILKGMEKKYNLDRVTRESKNTIKEKISKSQYIIDNEVKVPNSPYECNFFNLFNLIFMGYPTLVFTFFFLLLIFDITTTEFENGSYKIMYSTKESITKIVSVKAITSLILVFSYILLIITIFSLTGLIFGFGTFSYPYSVDTQIFQIGIMVIFMLLLYTVSLITLSGMVLLISYITNSSSVTLVVMIMAYMMVIIFQQIFEFQNLYAYIPFCYPFVREIIQENGIMVCSSIGIIVFIVIVFVCMKYMKGKDLLV